MDPKDCATTKKVTARTVITSILLSGVVLLLVAMLVHRNQLQDVPLKPSKETTLVTEPLDSNGQVDFPAAFEIQTHSEKIATTNNGYRLVVQNVQIHADYVAPSRLSSICRKLGLDADLIEPKLAPTEPLDITDDYFDSKDFDAELIRQIEWEENGRVGDKSGLRGHEDKDEVGYIIHNRSLRPWTEDDLPMLAEWVREIGPVLELFAEAVRKETFEVPTDISDESRPMHPYFSLGYRQPNLNSVATAFAVRANYHVGKGNIRQAIDDIISCKRMGRHLRNHGTLFFRSWGLGIESLANAVGIINVENDQTTKEDLVYFVNQLRALPKLTDLEQCILNARLARLDWLSFVSLNKPDRELDDYEQARRLRELGLDWNVVCREFNKAFDEAWESRRDVKIEDLEVTSWDFLSRKTRSRKFGRWYGMSQEDWCHIVGRAHDESVSSDRLLEITLAILRYEKDNRTLPPAFTVDEQGNPLHSWRILILPYLGHQKLYDSIRLEEPWNSPHNSKFHSQCPSFYNCPGHRGSSISETCYSVVIGPDHPFQGSLGVQLKQFGKDSNDMILVTERTDPVNWMNPMRELTSADLKHGVVTGSEIDKSPSRVAGRYRNSLAGYRNGSAYFLPNQLEQVVFLSLFNGTNKKHELY